ncbi:MAG: glycosyltransferase family 39 protein [Candidatus Sumerlaeia bacterium]
METRQHGQSSWKRMAAAHTVGLILAGVAAAFWLWAELNWALISDATRAPGRIPNPFAVFGFLFRPWSALGHMDWQGFWFGLAAVVFFAILGGFLIECFEIYIGRAAWLALAYLFGLGAAGFVFECLAIPHRLSRFSIAVSLGCLLLALMYGAWRSARRPPQSIPGTVGDSTDTLLRRSLARHAYRSTLERPRRLHEKLFAAAALLVIGAITAANFWHALLYPEVYWDSLILYLGYARMTFLEGGFPVKVCGQVGIGLGANYPHLYAVLGSGVSTAIGEWSELPQRLMAPLAGLASTVLVYHAALRVTRHINAALAVTLLYRSIPMGIMYDQYASDYALVILFTAAFLYLAVLYIQDGLPGYFVLATLLIGLSMHLNYLMGILWLPWALMILVRFVVPPSGGNNEAPWTVDSSQTTLGQFLKSRRFWLWLAAACAIGSTWYIRNWIVTGNPVYAFFYKILGGKNINPEVMQAAEREWQANGFGIGLFGHTVGQRILGAWSYFTGIVFNRNGGPSLAIASYNISPIFMGFAAPAFLVWLGAFASGRLGNRSIQPRGTRGFGLVVAALAVALLAFHFILAPFYLYQIISILPCLALLVALAWPWWRVKPWRWALGFLALVIGVAPGLGWALMGFKLVGPVEIAPGRYEAPQTLWPLRHPLPKPSQFYKWRYGEDAVMWDYMNENLKGETILTHENRDLVLDPSISLVNLDDWEMQPLWKLPPAERVRKLVEEHHIQYYLFVPNELATPTNARMGTADWEKLGLAELVFQAGESKLFKLKVNPEKAD